MRIGQLELDISRRELRRDGVRVPVGSRAFDILERLAAANGRIVSNAELMKSVWPDTVVEENNIQVHLSALRKAFGEERHAIVTVPGRGYRLALPNAPAAFDARLVPRPRPALPPLVIGLTGRDTDIARLRTLLDAHSIVTLTGGGGIGKTTLVVAIAHVLADVDPGSVAFVELASLNDEDGVLEALGRACGASTVASSEGIAALGARLTSRASTLVLDNAEHLIGIIADVVERLHAAHPLLRVLVTSREPLRIDGEVVYRVQPLDVPARGASEQEALAQPAVHLFLSRATALNAGAGFTANDVLLVGEICRRLDGIPLAIELAAARTFSFGIQGVHRHLDDRMALLTGGYRTAPPRHRTLRATLDWSFELLGTAAQSLFRRLAMFGGIFTLEAICAVVCDSRMSVGSAIDSIGELAAKSMISIEFDGPVARYRMNESTRAYALEQLQACGEMAEIASRMAAYLASQLAANAPRLPSPAVVAQFSVDDGSEVHQSLEDARAACDWAFSSNGDTRLGIELASALADALLARCKIEECGAVATRAVDILDTLAPGFVSPLIELRVRAALAAALPSLQGPVDRCARLWSEVALLARATDDHDSEARALWGEWNAALYGGKVFEAIKHATRFQEEARERNCTWQTTLAALLLAVALHCAGQHEQAKARIEASMQYLAAHPGDALHIRRVAVEPLAMCYSALARIVWLQGDTQAALQYADKAVNLISPQTMEPWLTHVLGVVAVPLALLAGDMRRGSHYLAIMRSQASLHGFTIWREYSEAWVGYRDLLNGNAQHGLPVLEASLDALAARGFQRFVTPLIVACARALIASGRLNDAAVRLEEAIEFCRQNGEQLLVPEIWRALASLALARAKGDVAERAAHQRRAEACFAEAIRLARMHRAHRLELRVMLDQVRMQNAGVLTDQELTTLRARSSAFQRGDTCPDVRALFELIDAGDIAAPEPAGQASNPESSISHAEALSREQGIDHRFIIHNF
jgi:predicted ATPase